MSLMGIATFDSLKGPAENRVRIPLEILFVSPGVYEISGFEGVSLTVDPTFKNFIIDLPVFFFNMTSSQQEFEVFKDSGKLIAYFATLFCLPGDAIDIGPYQVNWFPPLALGPTLNNHTKVWFRLTDRNSAAVFRAGAKLYIELFVVGKVLF